MEDKLFELLYNRISDYFSRNRNWFNEYFILIERYDRENNEFYYVQTDKLFLEHNQEIKEVLSFFKTSNARGSLNDINHHTSLINKKFNNNTLKVNDFKVKSLKSYFDKILDSQDAFVCYKKRLLQLKISEYQSYDTHYFSFPLIAFNLLQGSIHILFNADNLEYLPMKMRALFRNSIVIFTELYESIWQKISKKAFPDFRELAENSTRNSFLKDLDYPTFYLSRLMAVENFQSFPYANLKKSNKNSVFQKIAEFIGNGETVKALNMLEEFTLGNNQELYRLAVISKFQLAQLNKERIRYAITNEEYRVESNKINFSILSSLKLD